MCSEIAAYRVRVGDRRQDMRIHQVRKPELGQIPVGGFNVELSVFQLHGQSMEVRAEYSGRQDRIFEGARAIIAGTLVRFAIEAVARTAQVTSQGAVD